MKFITILSLLFSCTNVFFAQEVTLQVQVLYDGESARPAGKSTVYFSDGQMVNTNAKGILSKEFILTDSVQLVKIQKIVTKKGEAKIVNSRHMQYILLGRTSKKVELKAYILDQAEWTAREASVQKAVDDHYKSMEEIFNSISGLNNDQTVQEKIRGYHRYKYSFVSNLTSTVYAELTEAGKKAYNLFLASNENLPEVTSILEQSMEEGEDHVQDLLLLARLSVMSFDMQAEYYYLYLFPIGNDILGTMMEYKEAAIMQNQYEQLLPGLIKLLRFVKDPEFQAANRNDLSSIYQEQGDYLSAVTEANIALDYYKTLEQQDSTAYRLKTTVVMFNLGNAYMKLEQYDESLNLFNAVLQRISHEKPDGDIEIQSIGFYANKFIANLTQKTLGLREAYPYYVKVFNALKEDPEISLTLPKDMLFGDHLSYCESMELNGASADKVADCYEESIKFLDNAFDAERKTLGRTIVYHKLGEILEAKGENEKALEFYKRSLTELEQNETAKTRNLRMELYTCIGELLDDYGQNKEALDYFHRSITLAQSPGNESDANSIRQLGLSWYKIGQHYYKTQEADSAYAAFSKTIVYLSSKDADQQKNASLLANTYNMLGATLSELKNDHQHGEENFRIAVDMYSDLAVVHPAENMVAFATAAHNFLAMQAKHPETTDKEYNLALIDEVMKGLIMNQIHSSEITAIESNMNRFMLLFSGQLTAIQNVMMEVQTLSDQRQEIKGNKGKSDIQSSIVSKLEEAYQQSDPGMKDQLKDILSRESGNLSWYAIFDLKFALAESSARRALEVDTNQTWVNTNLAHSLILQNKIEEGKAIYDQFKDVIHTDGQLMRVIFLADIDEMEKEGIKHPAWEEVRRMLRE